MEGQSSQRHRDVTNDDRRSVRFSVIPSSTLRTIMARGSSNKAKPQRRVSRGAERSVPKLIFDYGPTTFRGLLLHRKTKLAPFAEHLQRQYPQIRVYYHPINDYNVVCVRLKDCIVLRMLLSNVHYSATEDITKNAFYHTINRAIQRMIAYPNLLAKPFRDAVCLMTHNLDVDYDIPWYRTEFPRTSTPLQPKSSSLVVGSSQRSNLIAAPCLTQTQGPNIDSELWRKFLYKIEESPEFESMLEAEFSDVLSLKDSNSKLNI